MKTLVGITLFLCFTFTLTAGISPNNKCRVGVTDFYPDLNIETRFTLDLLQGIWLEEDKESGTSVTFQFRKSGHLDIITMQKNGNAAYQQLEWKIVARNGVGYLSLKEESQQVESQLKIDQTCEGITLTDFRAGQKRHLIYQNVLTVERLTFIKQSLVGTWTNSSYPFNWEKCRNPKAMDAMQSAFLNYEFQKDGTFFQYYGHAKLALKERGRWEVSKDGQFLIFHHSTKDTSPQIAKILHLDLTELVIEQSFNSKDSKGLFSTELKNFAFIK